MSSREQSVNTWYTFLRDANNNVYAITAQGTYWTYGPEIINKRVNIQSRDAVKPVAIPGNILLKYTGHTISLLWDTYRFIETDGTRLHHRFQGVLQELIPAGNNKFVRKEVRI